MKTRLIFAAMLLMAFSMARAQETLIPVPNGDGSKINTIVISGNGSVWLQQGDKLTFNDYGSRGVRCHVEDSVLYVEGNGTRGVTFPNLMYLKVSGTAGVRSKDQLRGSNLSICKDGTGELSLSVNYDNVYICLKGTGDAILTGDCRVFCGEMKSIGRLNTSSLKYMVKVEKSGDQWNMAFNIDDDLNDLRKNYLQDMVKNAKPFFETESSRNWDLKKKGTQSSNVPDMAELDELMREYNDNLQRVYDSIDWKRVDEEIRRANQELQRVYDSLDWESIEAQMKRAESEMERWGRKMEQWGKRMEDKYSRNYEYHHEYNNRSPEPKKIGSKDKRPVKKNLLFDAHWNGFGAGLNLLLDPGSTANLTNDYNFLDLRPLRSWVFNFNIADVGIAFDRRHIAGLYTGIGLSWNNYSFNNPIRLIKGETHLEGEWIDPAVAVVKKSKLGVLYLQVPLMIEVRPTRRFNIAAGVTGGLRIDTWTNIKFLNGDTNKVHNDYYVNPFKLDASLRVGGEYLGFFADYNLLPTFNEAHAPSRHTVSFGFSLNF